MLANIEKQSDEYVVRFERHLKHARVDVWAMLTNNERLSLWFDELRIVELGNGGYYNFDMGDGTFQKMDILDYKEFALIEFTWDDNIVRFELSEEPEGCKLVLLERVTKITEHTPKDLAGWHVCLDVIKSILDNQHIDDRMEQWNVWYEKYSQLLDSISK